MPKRADYYVSAVRYNNKDEDHIEAVKRHAVSDDNSFNESSYDTMSRSTVVSDINNKWKYLTIVKNERGGWSFGEDIRVVNIEGEDFIRTDQNNTKRDNLGNLPTF